MKSIILMSGGLDSLVSLGLEHENSNITLALTFDYGQKASQKEIEASKKICEHYGIEHKIIKLDWLKAITQTALVSQQNVPSGEALENPENSAKSVWVPNRNGLFLNIAGSFADSYSFDYIIMGANKEEGQTFPDNTQDFIDAVNQEFKYSTLNFPLVKAPLIKYNKNDIVKLALEHKIPLELTMSCYQSEQGHCGICESCSRLKNALASNNDNYYTRILFK